MQADDDGVCGVCGEPLTSGMKTAVLFGRRVSARCRHSFDMRRELAYVVDSVLILVLVSLVLAPVALLIGEPEPDGSPNAFAALGLQAFIITLFLAKDSVRGTSPGKLLCGLQVVDAETGRSIGLRQSLQRNLIVLIPLMPIVLAFQMRGGPRWGEGWARTRVLLRKRRDAPAFGGTGTGQEDWSSASA